MRRAVLALGLMLSLPAFAGSLREPVLAALGGVEDVPTAADLQGLGDNVPAELLEIAQDSSLSHTTRARAVIALGWFPNEPSRSWLVGTLGGGDGILARKAAFALATGWGDEAVPLLQPALAADDVQLRLAAVRALGRVDSVRARASLDQRLAVETNATVQDTIRKTLAR